MRLMWFAERPHDLKLTVPPRSMTSMALVGVGLARASEKMTLNDDVKPPRWPGWACLG